MPDIECELCIKHANMIAELGKKLADNPEFACCSCEWLLQRKNVTAFDFSESKFTFSMWEVLRAYMYMSDPEAPNKTHYVCQYCRPILNRDQLPSRCVLNGLEVEPVPIELESLDPLSKQLIQRAKAFVVYVALEHPGLPSLVLSVQGCCYSWSCTTLHVSCKEYIVNVLSIIMCICLSPLESCSGAKLFQQQCDDIGGGVPTLETPNSSRS